VDSAAAFATALAFAREYHRAAAADVVDTPLGPASRDLEFPRAHVLNLLWVTAIDASLDGIRAACDLAQGELPHRKAFVADPALGAGLEPSFRAADWTVEREAWMVLARERDRVPRPGLAAETDAATHAALERASTRELPHGADPEVGDQLAGARVRLRAPVAATLFAGIVDGTPAAHATLLSDGRTAQVEDVATLIAFRRRGLARAVVSAAVDVALAAGHKLIFILADDEDWPKELYGKLGFEVIATTRAFIRRGPERHVHGAPRSAQSSARIRRPPA
jgi:ribosomal protein S18 acetylase RimI-like enzyme